MTIRRALFLSGSHGKGHDTLAEACADALAPYGVESKVLDCGPLMGRGPGVIADRVFRALLSSTPVYAGFHYHLTKPVDLDKLVDILVGLVRLTARPKT